MANIPRSPSTEAASPARACSVSRQSRGRDAPERATENVRSEVKLREVETELSVAQASTDLIATGVLDYSVAPEKEDEDDLDTPDVSEAAT